ncbi:hypothetical protein ZEAMMB73_Zm00001d016101 [Zea mays]|uniref:Uncharacterized protein n=1 Tax=Zea mays TaxID=4577 RepID=A0A1D6H5H0_MAIZE|nr:hypothetical protein ZEAMMB73_Zm00001d016101 [Zea mays]AQK70067.1 hypothetical protein ZEAMMB73_Zm00001d016101 [Zea mays]
MGMACWCLKTLEGNILARRRLGPALPCRSKSSAYEGCSQSPEQMEWSSESGHCACNLDSGQYQSQCSAAIQLIGAGDSAHQILEIRNMHQKTSILSMKQSLMSKGGEGKEPSYQTSR